MVNRCDYVKCGLLLVVLVEHGAHGILRKPLDHDANGDHPLAYLTAPEMLHYWGYPAESHRVTTEDGYILTMHRVPFGRTEPAKPGEKRQPILLGHGLFGSSESILIRGGNDSLIYPLAEEGFDVWVGNYRGSYYGKKHVSLSSKDPKFWDFSWHHNGVYDTPAMIDYIVERTGFPSVLFIGFSMSSTAQLALLSERPEYSDRIKGNFLMGPASYFSDPGPSVKPFGALFGGSGVANLLAEVPLTDFPRPGLCIERTHSSDPRKREKLREFCRQSLTFLCGPTYPSNGSNVVGLLYHMPSGVSFSQLSHYGQNILHSGTFRQYDYGPSKNMQQYGELEPPPYDLARIRSPVYLYCGKTDTMASPEDCGRLAKVIPTTKGLYNIPSSAFNHLDALVSDYVYELLFKKVISQVLEYK